MALGIAAAGIGLGILLGWLFLHGVLRAAFYRARATVRRMRERRRAQREAAERRQLERRAAAIGRR